MTCILLLLYDQVVHFIILCLQPMNFPLKKKKNRKTMSNMQKNGIFPVENK